MALVWYKKHLTDFNVWFFKHHTLSDQGKLELIVLQIA